MSSDATITTREPASRSGAPARVLLAAAFTVVAWASAFVVIRFVGHDFSAGALSLGRLAIGSVCLSAVMLIGRRWVPMNRRDWSLVALIGVLWFGVYNVALNAGEQHVDAGTAAMLIQLASSKAESPCAGRTENIANPRNAA